MTIVNSILWIAQTFLSLFFKILPVFTPLAAAGLVLLMIGAIIVHIERSEKRAVRTNVLLMFLALFVFVGRLWILPVV